jgi:hypothetical protein
MNLVAAFEKNFLLPSLPSVAVIAAVTIKFFSLK